MLWNIGQLLMSIMLIIGGLSGEYVLRGTNSSMGLAIVGFLWLIYDIYKIVTFENKTQNTQSEEPEVAEEPEK